MNTESRLEALAERYGRALRRHLARGAGEGFGPALRLGREAVTLGLETLELARIHERALIALGIPGASGGLVRRAEIFFTEVITPIVETHRAARRSRTDLARLNETLSRRTQELATTNRQLQQGIRRRKTVEDALKKSGIHYTRLLQESLQLQSGLRQLTHRVLAAQEVERRKISLELQDEVAQTLLGINVRLISLKRDSRVSTAGLKKEIASTQRLVAQSERSVRRVATRFSGV